MRAFWSRLLPSEHFEPSASVASVPQRFLKILRIVWLVEALVGGGLVIASLPFTFIQLQTMCTGASCHPNQLSVQQAQMLQHVGISLMVYALAHVIFQSIFFLTTYGLASVIMWHQSKERVAVLFAFVVVGLGALPIEYPHTLFLEKIPLFLPIGQTLYFIQSAGFLAIFCLFPNGRCIPRWSWIFIVVATIQSFFESFFPQFIASDTFLRILDQAMTGFGFLFAFSIQVYRYRWVSNRMERQQTKWVVFGLFLLVLYVALTSILVLINPILGMPASLFPPLISFLGGWAVLVSILPNVLAIVRYRLWDIDILINRTLVYLALSGCVVGLYMLIVLTFGTLFQGQGNVVISLFATGMIALLFHPLRAYLQRSINRLMFGERDEPYRVLIRLGYQLEAAVTPDILLPTVVETVAQALKMPFVAISPTLQSRSTLIAVYGQHDLYDTAISLPLVHQTETIGYLLLAPRQRGEGLTTADRRLLTDLTPQIAVALHNLRLTQNLQHLSIDLQRARELLVTTREEERRRLRRDLHDGLGQQLSSHVLTITAAYRLIRQNPEKTETLLKAVITQTEEAIIDVRRLIYALRPPILDDRGLVAALQEQIKHYRSSQVQFFLRTPESLPVLPAAVEVACYRIVQEALTNIIRHAHLIHAILLCAFRQTCFWKSAMMDKDCLSLIILEWD